MDNDAESKWADYLKYKNMYVEYFISDEEMLQDNFIEKATEIFAAMKPFNDFLNKALKDFTMPTR